MIKEIFTYFLRLGLTGFGGPAALIAVMQRDLIDRRHWMSPSQFQRVLPLIKSMPGPVAFQTAVFLGRHRAGWLGGVIAGVMLIFPAFLMMLILAYGLGHTQIGPGLEHFLRGLQLAALAVVLGSVPTLARGLWNDWKFLFLGVLTLGLAQLHLLPEPILILGMGSVSILLSRFSALKVREVSTLLALFLVCFKAGAFLFGSGLAIVPLLRSDVVDHYAWMTHSQFLNALSFGQMTPGPVIVSVTYMGTIIAGLPGALVATVAAFLPGLIHMLTWFPRMTKWLEGKDWVFQFTRGALAAVIATILISVVELLKSITPTALEIGSVVFVGITLIFVRLPAWAVIPVMGAVLWQLTA